MVGGAHRRDRADTAHNLLKRPLHLCLYVPPDLPPAARSIVQGRQCEPISIGSRAGPRLHGRACWTGQLGAVLRDDFETKAGGGAGLQGPKPTRDRQQPNKNHSRVRTRGTRVMFRDPTATPPTRLRPVGHRPCRALGLVILLAADFERALHSP